VRPIGFYNTCWCDPLFFTAPPILSKPEWLDGRKGQEFNLGFRNSVFWFPGIIKWKRPDKSLLGCCGQFCRHTPLTQKSPGIRTKRPENEQNLQTKKGAISRPSSCHIDQDPIVECKLAVWQRLASAAQPGVLQPGVAEPWIAQSWVADDCYFKSSRSSTLSVGPICSTPAGFVAEPRVVQSQVAHSRARGKRRGFSPVAAAW